MGEAAECERAVGLFDLPRPGVRTLVDELLRAEALGVKGHVAPDVAIVSASSELADDLLRHAHCAVLFVPEAS